VTNAVDCVERLFHKLSIKTKYPLALSKTLVSTVGKTDDSFSSVTLPGYNPSHWFSGMGLIPSIDTNILCFFLA